MERVYAAFDIGSTFTPITQFKDLGTLVTVILKNAFVVAGVLAFVLVIFGGFGMIVAGGSGDPKKLEESQKTLTAAVTGLILIIASVWIIQVIETLTGMKGQLVPLR